MTDQVRTALLAWLDEQINQTDGKELEASDNNDFDIANYFFGSKNAYRAVKAHIESEAAHDEA